jgi:hypothetical protein
MQVCTATVYELSSRRLTIGQTDRRLTIQILQPQQRQYVDQQATCVTHDHGTGSINTDLSPTVYTVHAFIDTSPIAVGIIQKLDRRR